MKRVFILLLLLVILSNCSQPTPTYTAKEQRQTSEAQRKTKIAEKTLHPDYPPVTPELVSPNDTKNDQPINGSIQVEVADPDSKELLVRFYIRPHTEIINDFSIIAIPDTQIYAYFDTQMAMDQTRWISDNREALNIVAAAHLGDSVHVPSDLKQWEYANRAFLELDPSIPYGISVGNHDQDPFEQTDGESTVQYNKYFGLETFSSRTYYGGHYGDNNDNSYILFSASGLDFVMLFLEFDDDPNIEVMDWAKSVLQSHPTRIGIVVVHSLLYQDGSWTTQGEAVFRNLKKEPNLRLMLGGHIPGQARRTDLFNGNVIHSILSDYQEEEEGGNGKLRIMRFSPAENTLFVTTYSPTTGEYYTDDASTFSLPFELIPPYTQIGQEVEAKSGSTVRQEYKDLLPGMQYDWFAEVSDGMSTIKSPVWTFNTLPK